MVKASKMTSKIIKKIKNKTLKNKRKSYIHVEKKDHDKDDTHKHHKSHKQEKHIENYELDEKFTVDNCAPKKTHKNSFTCYNDSSLLKIVNAWNKRHSDEKIEKWDDMRDLWEQLRGKIARVEGCYRESCWLNKLFAENKLSDELRNFTFSPKHPKKWLKNKNEWLTSVDIMEVMQQYEKAYPSFDFIGPSPIDYNHEIYKDDCVNNELCNFSLKDFIQKPPQKNKLGVVFNLDPHNKGGSHWVAVFYDVKKKIIFYFDSNGTKIPANIKKFIVMIQEQANEICEEPSETELHSKVCNSSSKKNVVRFDQNHPKEHQKENTECGVYVLYFLISILTGEKDFDYFKTKTIPDIEMEKLRSVLFNKP